MGYGMDEEVDYEEEVVTAEHAKDECEGCRLSWRYVSAGSWRHRLPMSIICKAQDIRIKLGRAIAPGKH